MPQHSKSYPSQARHGRHLLKAIPVSLLLTPGVINRVSVVVFLIAESKKAWMRKAVLDFRKDEDRLQSAILAIPTQDQLL